MSEQQPPSAAYARQPAAVPVEAQRRVPDTHDNVGQSLLLFMPSVNVCRCAGASRPVGQRSRLQCGSTLSAAIQYALIDVHSMILTWLQTEHASSKPRTRPVSVQAADDDGLGRQVSH